jgi:putative peptide zinc metalloprotease protein
MNLAEALNSALPELPVHQARTKRLPKLDPKLIAKQQIEDGTPVIVANMRGTTDLYRFSPEQWELIQLFDGVRDYPQVAEEFKRKIGVEYSPEDIREFAANMGDSFWYKTPQERNIALSQKLAEHRHQHIKKASKFGDVSRIQVSHWDPDQYFDKVYSVMKFVFSRWFTLLTLALFSFMIWVFFDRWSEIGVDTLKYYTFTEKSAADFGEFWLLFFTLAFFHESSHGLTCKHYGGQVHQMGFHLIFLTPAFFVDVTEAWVYAGRWQRLVTIIAGIWVEMIFCAVGTIVWWGTAPGTFAHELAYKVMLITGVAVVLVNMNPLIKLDGYYFFSELLGIADVKEKSTAYVMGWIKKNIFRLPVEVDYVPKRRRFLYVPYCILSGAYSYMLLLLATNWLFHVFQKFSPDWAFVPALWVGYKIFKSRIRTLVNFMKLVYLDKKEHLQQYVTPRNLAIGGAAVFLFLILPWRHVALESRFILEPADRAVVRARVPGSVSAIYVVEGQSVSAGQPLAKLRNLSLESEAAEANANAKVATARATTAQMTYVSFGAADRDRRQAEQRASLLQDEVAALDLRAPIGGVVTTPKPGNSLGSYMAQGDDVVEVADTSAMLARVYVPEFDIGEVQEAFQSTKGAPAVMHFDGLFASRPAVVSAIAPASTSMASGLAHVQDYKGIPTPHFYEVMVRADNSSGDLREGMTGTAKIFVARRPLLVSAYQMARDFVRRKLW